MEFISGKSLILDKSTTHQLPCYWDNNCSHLCTMPPSSTLKANLSQIIATQTGKLCATNGDNIDRCCHGKNSGINEWQLPWWSPRFPTYLFFFCKRMDKRKLFNCVCPKIILKIFNLITVVSWNCMQAHGTSCKLMELHVSSGNSMQAYVTPASFACMLM